MWRTCDWRSAAPRLRKRLPDIHASMRGFTRVYGPSGCGKSTLLDVLAGLSTSSEGTITFEGKPVAGQVPDGIGVVFQEDASFPLADGA
jgi:NitT/TauT family transport system ATP-binding protein